MEKVVQVPQINQPQIPQVVKKFSQGDSKNTIFMTLIAIVVCILGVGTGFVLASGGYSSSGRPTSEAPGVTKTNNEVGMADEKTFRDSAEGTLEEGGIDGEGTHHLVRPGGDSQSVYLTSTVIDLSSFKGKKVQVWGETISARKAGWLMDVGKVKVLE